MTNESRKAVDWWIEQAVLGLIGLGVAATFLAGGSLLVLEALKQWSAWLSLTPELVIVAICGVALVMATVKRS